MESRRGTSVWLVAAQVSGIALVGWLFFAKGHKRPDPRPQSEGFSMEIVPADTPSSGPAYVSRFEKERDKRLAGPVQGLDGFVPESSGPGAVMPVERGQAPGGPPGNTPAARDDAAAELRKEREFLLKHGAILKAERFRIAAVVARYSKEQPVVEEVLRRFGVVRATPDGVVFDKGKAPVYDALYQKLQRDDDIYSFIRGFLALPEARQEIGRTLKDPEAMKAGIMMLADLLAARPPAALFTEFFRFASEDAVLYKWMASDFWPTVLPRLPGALQSVSLSDSSKQAVAGLAGSLASGGEPPAALLASGGR